MMDDDSTTLQAGEPMTLQAGLLDPVPDCELGVDGRRWGVLALALALGSMQGASWIVFSTSDTESRTAFDLGDRGSLVLDWVMNIGTITFVLVLPLFTRAVETRGARTGLHYVMTVSGCHLACLAAALRCGAIALRGTGAAVPLLFASAAVNGAAAPGFYFSSAVAELWFPEGERFLALSLLAIPGTTGPLLAFLCALFVDSPARLATLVYCDAAAIGGLALLWWRWAPAHPRLPPSAAAARDFAGDAKPRKGSAPLFPRVKPVVWLLCCAAALSSGFFQVWTDAIADALHASSAVTQNQTQVLGFVANAANLVGGVGVGPLVARCGLDRRLKAVLVAALSISVACYATFACALPLGVASRDAITLWKGCPFPVLAALVAAASACVGITFPCIYDLCAEFSYPQNPAASAAALNYALNGLQVLFMAILPFIPPPAASAIMAVVATCCLLLVLPIRPTYARLDGDERARRRDSAA